MKECCKNCKHLIAREICYFCGINGSYRRFPRLQGGTKYCECYEKAPKVKTVTVYPKKEGK